jgi:hypothetical protein
LKIETTQIYLRRRDNERAMERVRDLTWGDPFASIEGEARSIGTTHDLYAHLDTSDILIDVALIDSLT